MIVGVKSYRVSAYGLTQGQVQRKQEQRAAFVSVEALRVKDVYYPYLLAKLRSQGSSISLLERELESTGFPRSMCKGPSTEI